MDDFLFTELMLRKESAEEMARLIIGRATGLEVKNLEIEYQKVVNGLDTGLHGIRMDMAVSEQESVEGESSGGWKDIMESALRKRKAKKPSDLHEKQQKGKCSGPGTGKTLFQCGRDEEKQGDWSEVYEDAGSDGTGEEGKPGGRNRDWRGARKRAWNKDWRGTRRKTWRRKILEIDSNPSERKKVQ